MKESTEVEGFPINGVEVKRAEEKSFEIMNVPHYTEFQDGDQVKRRLRMLIKFNDEEMDYFPNKTSQATIIRKLGRKFKDWVGFKGKFTTKSMLIGKDTKEVIFIEEKENA